MHCKDVGLGDPAATAFTDMAKVEQVDDKHIANPRSYNEWIKDVQVNRNKDKELNVEFKQAQDTDHPPAFEQYELFHAGAEKYAMQNTTVVSQNIQNTAKITQECEMFAPCMVGSLESQFLKMTCQIKGATNVLDVGTFTGMSAIAMAEGIRENGKCHTIEFYQETADVAKKAFEASNVSHKIVPYVGAAADVMRKMLADGMRFDIVFIDADKENYVEYYDLAMSGLLKDDGIILADNSLCALLYDKEDMRSQRLHEFN